MLMHWEGRHLRRALWVGRDHELLTKGCVGSASLSDIAAVISKGVFIMPGRVPGVGPFPQARGGWRGAPPVGMAEKLASATLYLALMTQTCLAVGRHGSTHYPRGPIGAQ